MGGRVFTSCSKQEDAMETRWLSSRPFIQVPRSWKAKYSPLRLRRKRVLSSCIEVEIFSVPLDSAESFQAINYRCGGDKGLIASA
jgi:hypothetical protein